MVGGQVHLSSPGNGRGGKNKKKKQKLHCHEKKKITRTKLCQRWLWTTVGAMNGMAKISAHVTTSINKGAKGGLGKGLPIENANLS